MIGYTCKYTPIEIFAGFGEECRLLSSSADNFDCAQNLLHPNICSHVKGIVEEIHNNSVESFIFVSCCDSLRRAYDALKWRLGGFVFFLDLPHSDSVCAKNLLKAEILRLIREYENFSRKSFDINKFRAAFENKKSPSPKPFIAISGARCEKELCEKIAELSPYKTIDLTCRENRRLSAVPENLHNMNEIAEWYAAELLAQIPCMRMTDIAGRRELLNDENLKGLIYHTVKFCDYYDFEYRDLKSALDVPAVKIETDYTRQSFGQLSTRLEAFFETAGNAESLKKSENKSGKYFAGIDSGSTSTNLAVLDENGRLVASHIVKTGFSAAKSAEKALAEVGIDLKDIRFFVATGYGRKNITFVGGDVTEITCHARGAHYLRPEARVIIDIGGQDSKVIALDENGAVVNFVMNDKCAAGTGRFLENMARVLELPMEEMAKRGLKYSEDLTISSMCTVFAESEVVSLIAENKKLDDIIHALDKSVAVKISSLVSRAKAEGEVIMTGGVGRNKGVVREIEKQLEKDVFVPENPDLCGAIGAALIAMEQSI